MARHHPRNILLFRKNRYMPETEDLTNGQSETNSDNPTFITQDVLEQKLSEIQEMINRASNGVAKKLEKRIESLTQPKEENPQSLTIETLRSEYEQKLKDIQDSSVKELETFKQQLAEKERSEFLYKVDSTIASAFARQRFDDV
jgi:DNA topoisomerase VI subunit B